VGSSFDTHIADDPGTGTKKNRQLVGAIGIKISMKFSSSEHVFSDENAGEGCRARILLRAAIAVQYQDWAAQ
jgi:hypothetical protein